MIDLPTLDCHAHVSTSATESQLAELGSSVVMAMTRDLDEALEASQRFDANVLWGCGAHPAQVANGTARFDPERFRRRVQDFALIGEVGLDRRSGNLNTQKQVLGEILRIAESEPVMVSIHSAGCSAEVLRMLRSTRSEGLILHWFSGHVDQLPALLGLGCHFSVNSAMRRPILEALPLDRVLPETDFPVAKRRTGSRPGDTRAVENILSEIHGLNAELVRRQFYRNLRRVATRTGAIDRMQSSLADLLLVA